MLRAHGISDPGTTRKINEDSLFSDENLGLFVVADGMGGHAAGEVASRLAIEAVEGFIRRSQADLDFSWPYGIDASLSYNGNRLRTAISLANRRVFRAAESHDDYTGMGSTVAAALVAGRRVSIGSVGDSRVYLWSDSTLTLLTEDDTWVAMLRAKNASIDPAVLARHPLRHVLTNVLGAREATTAHVSERDLRDGDVLLLCSDGLHGPVPEDVIATRLIAAGDLREAAQGLVQAALDRGGRDNVTVLLVSPGGNS
jgi:PPM family protein phosphatase